MSDAPKARGRPGKSRPLLLEAAMKEFAEKGYEGTTTAGIARRARTNQPLVHHHFGSKEKLFREVLDTLFAQLHAAVLDPNAGPLDVRSLVSRFVRFTAERPELARLWVIDGARGGKHLAYMMKRHLLPLTEAVHPMVLAAMDEGLIPRGDPQQFLWLLQGMISYPFLVAGQIKQFAGVDSRSPDFVDAYVKLVLDTLLRTTNPAV